VGPRLRAPFQLGISTSNSIESDKAPGRHFFFSKTKLKHTFSKEVKMGDVRDAGLVGKIQSLWPGVFVAGVTTALVIERLNFFLYRGSAPQLLCRQIND